MKILYIPLDERPCNYKYPQYLSNMTNDVEILVPPKEYMGWLKAPADTDAIWNWVFDHAKECNYAIMSVDTLVYGNIINSRIHSKTKEECLRNISFFEKLKSINSTIEIHAFNLVTRVANYNSDAEDPFYWKEYGEMIWKYCYLTDKAIRSVNNDDSKNELDYLIKTIPEEHLTDFLDRRKINREVNLKCLELVKEKIIDYLVIPKDDCTEYGFAAMDQDIIAEKILEYRLMDRVMIYPGADEVGSVLFSRVFNRISGYTPKVYIRYSSSLGPFIIPKYEDRPLNEGIKSQITSLGGIIVNQENEADFLLAVNSPGQVMIESSEQNVRSVNNRSYRNTEELLNYIKYFSEKYKKPFAIADVAYANGADNEFMIYANKFGLLEKACAYGGWNTAQNTLGVVLAQASINAYYHSNQAEKFNKITSDEFTLRKIIEDWLYQSRALNELALKKDEYKEVDLYNVGKYTELVLGLIYTYIDRNIKSEFHGEFNKKRIVVDHISLPWNRVFEIDFDLKLLD